MTIAPVLSAQELATLCKHADVLVVDCRFDLADPGKGQRDYLAGHIPGAVYASLDHDLSDLSRTGLGRHPLPEEAAFSSVLSRWGWRAGMTMVAYDTAGGAVAAARLWWLMRLAGQFDVSVLDGGLAAWMRAGFGTEIGLVQPAPSDVRIAFDADAVVDFAELERARKDAAALVLDARGAPRFRGDVEPLDPVAGHVPGAVNRPFQENLRADGTFKSPQQLRAEFGALLAQRTPGNIVHMCGSGVTACHNLLAMERCGLSGSRLFAPSWSGWIADRSRPVVTGSDPAN